MKARKEFKSLLKFNFVALSICGLLGPIMSGPVLASFPTPCPEDLDLNAFVIDRTQGWGVAIADHTQVQSLLRDPSYTSIRCNDLSTADGSQTARDYKYTVTGTARVAVLSILLPSGSEGGRSSLYCISYRDVSGDSVEAEFCNPLK